MELELSFSMMAEQPDNTVKQPETEDEANSDSDDDEDEIPFLYLCEHGLVRAAYEKLTEEHEARDNVDAESRSGLHLAALNGQLRIVQLLLGEKVELLTRQDEAPRAEVSTVQIPAAARFTTEELSQCSLVDDYDNTPLSYAAP